MITVINYGMGNLGSVYNMLRYIGVNAIITDDPILINNASKLLLPGVGSFDEGMRQLRKLKLEHSIKRAVIEQKASILGICLGMQLLTKRSDEGNEVGLGLIDAETLSLRKHPSVADKSIKVPRMGWYGVNNVKNSPITSSVNSNCKFYFVHSYHVQCRDASDVLLETKDELQLVAGFQRDSIIGVQFHPEKSHKFGMNFLKSFSEI